MLRREVEVMNGKLRECFHGTNAPVVPADFNNIVVLSSLALNTVDL